MNIYKEISIMNSLEKRIENLTDEELQQCFEEIEEYNK